MCKLSSLDIRPPSTRCLDGLSKSSTCHIMTADCCGLDQAKRVVGSSCTGHVRPPPSLFGETAAWDEGFDSSGMRFSIAMESPSRPILLSALPT